jgi:hypothetical protein
VQGRSRVHLRPDEKPAGRILGIPRNYPAIIIRNPRTRGDLYFFLDFHFQNADIVEQQYP